MAQLRVANKVAGKSVRRIGRSAQKLPTAGVATLLLTDVHYGTAVHPEAVMGQNSYNRPIAKKRIERTVEWFIQWATREAGGKRFDGCVLALGGDMAESGLIEVVRGGTAISAINDLAHILANAVRRLQMAFGEVTVFGVPGNHGQNGKRVPMSRAAESNHDTEVYAELQRLLQGDPYVQVHFSRHAMEQVWYIYDVPFMLVHGDMMRPRTTAKSHLCLEAIAYRDKKAKQIRPLVPDAEDNLILLFGHWHTAMQALNFGFIAGGSIKGWDDWARATALVQETPSSQAWITHPKTGICSLVEVFAYEPSAAEDSHPEELPPVRLISAALAAEAFDCDEELDGTGFGA